MAVFDMMTVADTVKKNRNDLYDQGFEINNRYFHIDTADNETVHEWLRYNPFITTYAVHDNKTHGFFNLMPITTECARLFEDQALKEEDLSTEHMLKPEFLKRAEYAYFAAIAVKDTETYFSRQCVAAMLAVIASQLLYGYRAGVFKRLFANPTTFSGNEMIRRLGLKPLVAHKKLLRANDIYVMDMNDDTVAGLTAMSARYGRFVGVNPWARDAA